MRTRVTSVPFTTATKGVTTKAATTKAATVTKVAAATVGAVAMVIGASLGSSPASAAMVQATVQPGVYSTHRASSADVPSKTGLRFAPASLANPRDVAWNQHANWTEHYFTTPDGTTIHADVLRPKGIPDNVRTPVIMSVGPYFNHLSEVGVGDAVTNPERIRTLLDPTIPNHPNPRFHDFLNDAKVMEAGYTWVQVDLRGTGASTGCLDWNGPGEQQDVVTAVEWAAAQPWSNGRVGLFGKSYDGVTGLIAAGNQPRGLAAVVAQEPAMEPYTYLYNNEVPYYNAIGTSLSYDEIAASPGRVLHDTPEYMKNSVYEVAHPHCLSDNLRNSLDPIRSHKYWRDRSFLTKTHNSPVPLFISAGLIEDNTEPDGLVELLKDRKAPTRGWLGMWNHVRANEKDAKGNIKVGRPGYFAEVMDFYAHYLKGAVTRFRPNFIVQDNTGRWRVQSSWPQPNRTVTFAGPRGIVRYGTALAARTYGNGQAIPQADAQSLNREKGIWAYMAPQARDLHLSGNVRVRATVRYNGVTGKYGQAADKKTTAQRMQALLWEDASLNANIYDVAPNGKTLLITRGAVVVRQGTSTVNFQALPNDWVLWRGHRLAIRLVSSNRGNFFAMKAQEPIEVLSSSVTMDIDDARHQDTYGGKPLYWQEYMNEAGCYPSADYVCKWEGPKDSAPTP